MGRLRDAILGSGVSLYVKFILLTAVLLTTFGVTSTLVNIREQQITATDRLLEKAEDLASILGRAAVDPLSRLDVNSLRLLLGDTRVRDDVTYGYILDARGQVLADGTRENARRDQMLDDPLSAAALTAESTLIHWGSTALEIVEPVYLGSQKLGVVRLGFSLAQLAQDINEIRNRAALLGVSFVLAGILFTAILVRSITEPLQRLVEGTVAVSKGQLDKQILVETNDEIKTLADAFNRMTAELNKTTVSRDYVENVLRSMNDSLIVVSPDGLILTVNAATSAMLGYSEDDLVGQPLSLLLPPGDSLLQRMGPLELVQERAVRGLEKTYLAADGRAIPVMFSAAVMRDPHGDVAGIVSLAQDLTQRKTFEKELSRLAFHDALSNLPNRALFLDRLEHALVRSERTRVPVAVLFLDLDNFKVVNDSLGHQTGDRLLMVVADRLRECLRAEDTAARFGGDEFTVLVEDVADGVEAMAVAERIGETLRAPISLDGHEVFPSASIGIAISTVGVDDPDSLLRNADLAMYRAKTGGKSRCEVFDLSMNAGVMERLELEGDLRRAMARGELELHYQPIKSLASGRIVEVEALLRWTHPLRGSIPPDQFVPLAEETGLIVPLGQWVLETACRQAQLWQAEVPGRLAPIMSVNLSARQFQHRTLVEDIDRVLRETGLDPRQLTLEITESVVMHDAESTAATLRRLKGLGIGLAIDDFGTGYSSLSYLKRFPVDTLKIDRSFVDGLGDEGHDTAIVHSVIALAKSLHLAVTAEGIETAAQLEHLQRLGCDRGQGFYFSAAVPPERLSALLTANPVGRPIHGPRRAGVA